MSRDSSLICQRTYCKLGCVCDFSDTNTENEDPLRFVRFDSAEFIRIPTRERKLEPAHFCLPSRLNAMLQMMLNATAVRSHDASNIATISSREYANTFTTARTLRAAALLLLPSASAR